MVDKERGNKQSTADLGFGDDDKRNIPIKPVLHCLSHFTVRIHFVVNVHLSVCESELRTCLNFISG